MEGVLTTLVAVVFIVLELASEGMGLFCIGKKHTWLNSINACLHQGGTPLPYMTGQYNILYTHLLRQSNVRTIWTSEYLNRSVGSKSEELCGFRYMYTPFDIGQVFYGDCYRSRSYICWNSTSSKGRIEEGNHDVAISTCHGVTREVLNKIGDIFKPGYYWMKDSLIFRRMTVNVHNNGGRYEMTTIPKRNLLKCGAYSRDAGLYFRECSDQISSVCHFMNQAGTHGFRTCFKDSTTATKISTVTTGFTTPLNIVSTKEQSMEQSKETASMISFNTTESYLRDSSMQLETKSTSSENETKKRKEDKDLGTKVGLPVGLCLALLCTIILSIYLFRRYKCWNTTEKENNNTKAKHPSKQSTGRVVAHVNNSYEANEGIIVIKTTNQEVMKDESECQYKHQHYTDLDSEYAVAFKSNLGQNIEERNNLTETDYDVTGNVASCTSNTSDNIYNHFQSEQYDSSANVKRGDICNNEYGMIQSKESESVYDSTGQVNDSSPCDNVYNQLSLAISIDGQIYNDFTVNTSQIGQAKVTDQTYDKLK